MLTSQTAATRMPSRQFSRLPFSTKPLAARSLTFGSEPSLPVNQGGVSHRVKVKCAYPFATTVDRLRAEIAGKGITFFLAVDQSKLAAGSGIDLKPSTLLMFGNPPLGTQFMTSNPQVGLDWPVRLLVTEDVNGDVWASYTDFGWIARRHRITDRAAQVEMASNVIASITASVSAR